MLQLVCRFVITFAFYVQCSNTSLYALEHGGNHCHLVYTSVYQVGLNNNYSL